MLSAGALAALLTGCAIDALIWGPDGAEVIQTTEKLVSQLASGEATDLLCADSVGGLGQSSDWRGLSAGEPEKYSAVYWTEQAALDPQWSINLEGLPDGAVPGNDFPGNVFYRDGDDGLCITEVVWTTLISVG